MHLEHHLVGGYVRYISPHIIIIIIIKQRIWLSNIKQTTSPNAYSLYERLAGNQRNTVSKFFC